MEIELYGAIDQLTLGKKGAGIKFDFDSVNMAQRIDLVRLGTQPLIITIAPRQRDMFSDQAEEPSGNGRVHLDEALADFQAAARAGTVAAYWVDGVAHRIVSTEMVGRELREIADAKDGETLVLIQSMPDGTEPVEIAVDQVLTMFTDMYFVLRGGWTDAGCYFREPTEEEATNGDGGVKYTYDPDVCADCGEPRWLHGCPRPLEMSAEPVDAEPAAVEVGG